VEVAHWNELVCKKIFFYNYNIILSLRILSLKSEPKRISGLIINEVVLLTIWFAQELPCLTPIALLYSTILSINYSRDFCYMYTRTHTQINVNYLKYMIYNIINWLLLIIFIYILKIGQCFFKKHMMYILKKLFFNSVNKYVFIINNQFIYKILYIYIYIHIYIYIYICIQSSFVIKQITKQITLEINNFHD